MFEQNLVQKKRVLRRFKNGEHLSALSCLSDGVSPSSFTRIYKELKDSGSYVFDSYWSKTNPDSTKKQGAYKIRILIAEISNSIIQPIQTELII